jgi:pimeloyl-ACP methyl ester carboxylesterase
VTVRRAYFHSGGGRLAGTCVAVSSPVAAALLLPGAGNTDRDSTWRLRTGVTLRSGITRELAVSLAAARVTTMRYDKRGVGESEGERNCGMADRLGDAGAALGWLAAEAPGLPLLVIGHGEGACYAAELAARGRAAGIVLLSATARRGREVMDWRAEQLAAGSSRASRLVLRLFGTDPVEANRRNVARALETDSGEGRVLGQRVSAPALRDFMDYDPAPVLARVSVPVLALTGGYDMQIPPEDVEEIGRLVSGPFEGHVLDRLSHLLRPDPRLRGLRGYRRALSAPIGPQVPALISDWVGRHWGR